MIQPFKPSPADAMKMEAQSRMTLMGYKDYINNRASLYDTLVAAEHPNAEHYLEGWIVAAEKFGGMA